MGYCKSFLEINISGLIFVSDYLKCKGNSFLGRSYGRVTAFSSVWFFEVLIPYSLEHYLTLKTLHGWWLWNR
jgi:hypothetical protein